MAAQARTLLVAFFAVVLAFIGSTIWAQRASRAIDADTLLISRDAAPGIEVLSDLRAELRRFELEAFRAASGADHSAVLASRKTLGELLARAATLPNDSTESLLLGRLQAALRAFDDTVDHALQEAHAGHSAAALTLLRNARPRVDEAAAAAREIIDYNAHAAASAALRIERARQRTDRTAFELDALCAVLAVVAALVVLRVLRQVHRVQEQHHDLAERKAEELEQFAGRVAHDILSPLSAVGLSLAIAARLSPEARDSIDRGSASLARVRRIVDGLLEFARAGARPEPGARAEIAPVLAGITDELEPFAAECAATLHVDDPPACAVECSSGVLLSLLGNLVRNAIKYLGTSRVREVSVHIKRRRGGVLFEVEDTGPGVPPSLGARVFEPYVRGPGTGMPGIGLGLATVKRLVESHHGSVGLRTSLSGGAVFWFELPEAPARDASLGVVTSQTADV